MRRVRWTRCRPSGSRPMRPTSGPGAPRASVRAWPSASGTSATSCDRSVSRTSPASTWRRCCSPSWRGAATWPPSSGSTPRPCTGSTTRVSCWSVSAPSMRRASRRLAARSRGCPCHHASRGWSSMPTGIRTPACWPRCSPMAAPRPPTARRPPPTCSGSCPGPEACRICGAPPTRFAQALSPPPPRHVVARDRSTRRCCAGRCWPASRIAWRSAGRLMAMPCCSPPEPGHGSPRRAASATRSTSWPSTCGASKGARPSCSSPVASTGGGCCPPTRNDGCGWMTTAGCAPSANAATTPSSCRNSRMP